MKTVRTSIAFALAAMLMAAGSAMAAPKLNLGAASNNGGMIVFAGVDRGVFAKHGIDAKAVVRNTGAQLTKSLKAGQIDFAPAAFTNLPAALERGIKVRGIVGYVGASYSKPFTDAMVGIAVRPGTGISSIADLKGKKVGATFGSTGDLYLRTVLSKSGINKSNYRRINVRPPSLVSLFDSGGVDAMVAWEPYLTRMLDKVKGAKLVSRGGDHVCFCAGMHGVPDRVYRDKKVTQAFVNGMAESAAWVRDPKNVDEVVKIGVRYVRGVSPKLFKRTIKYWTYDPRLGENTFKAFNFSVKQLIAQKKMKRPYDPKKYFDLTFINRTMKEHPEWFKDLN